MLLLLVTPYMNPVMSQKMLYIVAGLLAIPVTVNLVVDRVFIPRILPVIFAKELQIKLPVVYIHEAISVGPE